MFSSLFCWRKVWKESYKLYFQINILTFYIYITYKALYCYTPLGYIYFPGKGFTTGQHVDRLCHISGMKLVYYKKYRLGVIVMYDYPGLSLNDLYAFSVHVWQIGCDEYVGYVFIDVFPFSFSLKLD